MRPPRTGRLLLIRTSPLDELALGRGRYLVYLSTNQLTNSFEFTWLGEEYVQAMFEDAGVRPPEPDEEALREAEEDLERAAMEEEELQRKSQSEAWRLYREGILTNNFRGPAMNNKGALDSFEEEGHNARDDSSYRVIVIGLAFASMIFLTALTLRRRRDRQQWARG